MGYNPRLDPLQAQGALTASVATDASLLMPLFVAKEDGQILGATLLNSDTTEAASGTTAGSSIYLYLYKTASNAASRVATWNGSGTNIAAQGSQALTMSTSTSLTRFSAGDAFSWEIKGGAANDTSQLDAVLVVDFIYGHAVADSTSP